MAEAKDKDTKAKKPAAKKPAEKKPAAKKPSTSTAAKKATSTAKKATATKKDSASAAKATSKTADAKASEAATSSSPARKAASTSSTKSKSSTASKPTAKTKAAEKVPERPVVNASARFVRVAPRKARLIADQVRGLPLEDAQTLLRFSPRGAAQDIAKVLDSAAANAENNHDLIADELLVKSVTVNEGPTLRRYRPRALGRATPINKRTSHISVALTPEEE
jgi:ribosomal protein L22